MSQRTEILCDRCGKEITKEQIDIAVELTKDEAVKEFAELLKKDFNNPYIQKAGANYVKFLKGVVDNRLNEIIKE